MVTAFNVFSLGLATFKLKLVAETSALARLTEVSSTFTGISLCRVIWS